MNKAEFLKMVDELSRKHAWELLPADHEMSRLTAQQMTKLLAFKDGWLAASKWWATELLKVFAAPEAMDFKHRLDELKGLAQELLEDEKK